MRAISYQANGQLELAAKYEAKAKRLLRIARLVYDIAGHRFSHTGEGARALAKIETAIEAKNKQTDRLTKINQKRVSKKEANLEKEKTVRNLDSVGKIAVKIKRDQLPEDFEQLKELALQYNVSIKLEYDDMRKQIYRKMLESKIV
jgi:hypothetical protein